MSHRDGDTVGSGPGSGLSGRNTLQAELEHRLNFCFCDDGHGFQHGLVREGVIDGHDDVNRTARNRRRISLNVLPPLSDSGEIYIIVAFNYAFTHEAMLEAM